MVLLQLGSLHMRLLFQTPSPGGDVKKQALMFWFHEAAKQVPEGQPVHGAWGLAGLRAGAAFPPLVFGLWS